MLTTGEMENNITKTPTCKEMEGNGKVPIQYKGGTLDGKDWEAAFKQFERNFVENVTEDEFQTLAQAAAKRQYPDGSY